MNRELLAAESPHVRAEYARVWESSGVLDRAVQLASEAIAAALRGEKVALTGHPGKDAPALEWHDYFVGLAGEAVGGAAPEFTHGG